jgi:hypothetical protein
MREESREKVVVLSGEVELLVESQSWAGAAAKLRQKTSVQTQLLPGGVATWGLGAYKVSRMSHS